MPALVDHRDARLKGLPARFPLLVTALTLGLISVGFTPASTSERGPHSDEARHEPNARGRDADRPFEIPAVGWKDILIRVWKSIGTDRVVAIAAGVTFYSVLALFPAIAALVALFGLFADPNTISSHLSSLPGVLPEGALEVVRTEVSRIAEQGSKSLGLTFFGGLAVAIWSANAGVKALFDALNMVYNEQERRGIIKLNAISLAFTAGAIMFFLLALSAMVIFPLALGYLGLSSAAEQIASVARWPALLLVVGFALTILYRFGPDRAKPRWRWVTWGSAFATVSWLAASMLFSYYAAHFGSYNKTYGSLGAVIGFMVWIWISIIVILLGAEINAQMEHQTAKDTTTGTPKPMGHRRATMADSLGPAQG